MKKIIYTIIPIFLILSLILLSGCSNKSGLVSYKGIVAKNNANGKVIANDKYTLEWNSKKMVPVLKDKVTDNSWCPIPDEVLNNNPIESGIKSHPQTESPIIVNYYDSDTYVENKAIAATSAVKNGKVSVTKIKNGFSAVYDFKSEKITVTVDYLLTDDGLSIEIDPSKITENPDKIVTGVSVAPFLCSVGNNSEDAYVFVPSGSGALIYSNIKSTKALVTDESVFGDDLSIYTQYEFTNKKSVRMPVYGSICGDKGIFAIIENGAANSSICTVSSDERLGYAAAYVNFEVRGYQTVDIPKGVQLTTTTAKVFSNPITTQKYSVKFIPLQGENISYYDMADIYRTYLQEKYTLASNSAEQAIALRLFGGVMTTEFNFGIPNDVLYPLTTLSEAKDIIEGISGKYKNNVRYILDGYGQTGLEIGKVAGGYKVSSVLGTNKQLSKLINQCEEQGINTSINYELLRYNKSSSGFSTLTNSAVAASKKRVSNGYISLVTRVESTGKDTYYLLSRNKILSAVKKLENQLDKNSINNVMLESLTNTLYSDYCDASYYAQGNEQQIYEVLSALTASGKKLAASDANIYAAVCADYIDNVPLSSSGYDAFDVDVPFYQIVLKGLVPMYSSSLVSSVSEQQLFLKAVETGIGLSMGAVANYSDTVFSSPQKSMFATNIENVKKHLDKLGNDGFYEYYSSVNDAQITSHVIINENVRKTVFDNGIEVYVNYSENEFVFEDLQIPPCDYVVKGG